MLKKFRFFQDVRQRGLIVTDNSRSCTIAEWCGEAVAYTNATVRMGEKLAFSLRLDYSYYVDSRGWTTKIAKDKSMGTHTGDQLAMMMVRSSFIEKKLYRTKSFEDIMDVKYKAQIPLMDFCYSNDIYICNNEFLYYDDRTYFDKNIRPYCEKVEKFVPMFEQDGDIRHYIIDLRDEKKCFFKIGCNDSPMIKFPFPKTAIKENCEYKMVLNFAAHDRVSILPFQYVKPKKVVFKKAKQYYNCDGCKLRSNDLKLCSRCKRARYCSRKCQMNCWNSHKKNCQKKV